MAYTFKHGDRPLDDYTIQRAVGGGGFGEVYYAISEGGREVALKYLRNNPEIELRGVSHTMNLKSPHLITIFDVKRNAQGQYFIIMEYCSGPSLRDLLIAEPSGFGTQKATFFLREIAKGLSYLHDRGIVHRDLKPGNIFYDDGYVKIGDYGLSKFISVSRHSAQTASVGTVHYMAPEIGSGNYSRGVDIYALGVILYEMLLGKVPFEGSSMGEVLMKHLTAQPAVDVLPEPFGRIIRRALQKDPRDRYQHVHEMVDELLAVDTVRESLAGFSTQSLEGAVRHGGRDRADSPIPSPNPAFPYQADFTAPARREFVAAPQPEPNPTIPMPERLVKRLERIGHKVDRKIAKLGGHRMPPPPPRQGASPLRPGGNPGALPQTVATAKRFLLCSLLTVGLSIGLGIAFGVSKNEEVGASAGMLVAAMWGGILLGKRAIPWFGMAAGPLWAQRLVSLLCAGPLLAIGSAPALDRYGGDALGLLIGLAVASVFAQWDRELEEGANGELKFGLAFRAAMFALIPTAIASAIFSGGDKEFALLAAAVAGVVSLAMQPAGWWLASTQTFRHLQAPARFATVPRYGTHQPVGSARPAMPAAYGNAPESVPPAPGHDGYAGQSPRPAPWPGSHSPSVSRPAPDAFPAQPLERWAITRAFWGIVSFALMGGAIVTFIAPLVIKDLDEGSLQGLITGCVALVSALQFTVRGTTPLRQPTFWRETVRPFLITVACFGLGASITAVSVMTFGDDSERLLAISGIVLSSMLLIVVTLLRGRRKAALPPVPFVQPPRPYETPPSALSEPAPSTEPRPSVEGA
jgi:hypothetical protein